MRHLLLILFTLESFPRQYCSLLFETSWDMHPRRSTREGARVARPKAMSHCTPSHQVEFATWASGPAATASDSAPKHRRISHSVEFPGSKQGSASKQPKRPHSIEDPAEMTNDQHFPLPPTRIPKNRYITRSFQLHLHLVYAILQC